MDREWVKNNDRLSDEYTRGVKEFLDFAFSHARSSMISCPCTKCRNTVVKNRDDVEADLIIHGMSQNYDIWIFHGESYHRPTNETNSDENDDMYGMIHDAIGFRSHVYDNDDRQGEECHIEEEPNEEAEVFYRLLKNAEQQLYPGCEKFSALSFIVKLLHIKCLNGWSNKSFTMLLEVLKQALPDGATLPSSYYEAKKIIRDLGLDYEKIDACRNDCILFRNNYADLDHCIECGASRWKGCDEVTEEEYEDHVNMKRIPCKVLRYFPLKPRLQRLYMSKKTSFDMVWHHEKRIDDGVLRHPADSKAWKDFDELHESFASEQRNVRLGLASDGFNPYGNMHIPHSTWPVVLVPYNLPPWMCMKKPFFILSLLIPGPKALGNDIDVYLKPLVDELNELWEVGVDTYDASRKQNFQLHAAVLWTINDFPAYANLSGWSTKGSLACPSCNVETCYFRLKNGRKMCYMGHRRFLPQKHKWRRDVKNFDGNKELRRAPNILSGLEVLDQLHGINFRFGKKNNMISTIEREKKKGKMSTTRKTKQKYKVGLSDKAKKIVKGKKRSLRENSSDRDKKGNWKKKSIFFNLPYWKFLLIRHNLDVMHIEKNVCDSIIGTLLNIDGKTKDNVKSRLDLELMGIRKELHPVRLDNGKMFLPPACYTLSQEEKMILCEFLKEIKVPDGYSSNISRCVYPKECKLKGLKSHDCHVIIQRLLPLAIRGLLPDHACGPIIELCHFFRDLGSKVLKIEDLDRLDAQIPLTLCKLEMTFPPSFFDIMVHLVIHLTREAKMAGPVQYRWMYPIERYLYNLKCYVRNRSHPEGSIAEGYIADECLTFSSRYLSGVETRFTHDVRNDDGGPTETSDISVFKQRDQPIGKSTIRELTMEELEQARLYVLKNCEEMNPFVKEYEETNESSHVKDKNSKDRHLLNWVENHVARLHKEGSTRVDDSILSIARGPTQLVNSYAGYIINVFRFDTRDREKDKINQNSGVFVKGKSNLGNFDYY